MNPSVVQERVVEGPCLLQKQNENACEMYWYQFRKMERISLSNSDIMFHYHDTLGAYQRHV